MQLTDMLVSALNNMLPHTLHKPSLMWGWLSSCYNHGNERVPFAPCQEQYYPKDISTRDDSVMAVTSMNNIDHTMQSEVLELIQRLKLQYEAHLPNVIVQENWPKQRCWESGLNFFPES